MMNLLESFENNGCKNLNHNIPTSWNSIYTYSAFPNNILINPRVDASSVEKSF